MINFLFSITFQFTMLTNVLTLFSKYNYMNQEQYNRLMIELMKQIIKNQSDIISMLKVKRVTFSQNIK